MRKSHPEACSLLSPKWSIASTTLPRSWRYWFYSRPRKVRQTHDRGRGVPCEPPCPLWLRLGRDPVNLFLHRTLFGEPATLQDGLAVLDHLRMSADVSNGICCVEFPVIRVLAQDVVGAPDLARPVRVVPGTA